MIDVIGLKDMVSPSLVRADRFLAANITPRSMLAPRIRARIEVEDSAVSGEDFDGQDETVDTTDLVNVLDQIASTDDVALAETSSAQIDDWLAILSQWRDTLSGGIA
jgi:hypothetical protein